MAAGEKPPRARPKQGLSRVIGRVPLVPRPREEELDWSLDGDTEDPPPPLWQPEDDVEPIPLEPADEADPIPLSRAAPVEVSRVVDVTESDRADAHAEPVIELTRKKQ